MSKTIYLEPDTEITHVIDKLRESDNDQIILVVPSQAIILQSIVNLKILKKQAQKLRKDLILVTTDPVGKNLASKVGITVHHKIGLDHEIEEQKVQKEQVKKEFTIKEKSALDTHSSLIQAFKKRTLPIQENIKDNQKESKSKGKQIKRPTFISKFIPQAKIEKKEEKPELSYTKTSPPLKKSKLAKTLIPKSPIIFLGAIPIILLGILLIASTFFTHAEIIIIPNTIDQEDKFEVYIDPSIESINLDTNLIPGQISSLEKEETQKEIPTTGTKEIGEKAKSSVTFYNEYSSDPQVISKGSTLLSQNLKFKLLSTITIPGAEVEEGETKPGQIQAEIEAAEIGKKYNIPKSHFSIVGIAQEKQDKIYAKSTSTLSGGKKEKVKIVSKKDVEKIQKKISEGLLAIIKEEIKTQISEQEMLPDSSFQEKLIELTTSKKIGERADTFDITVKIQAKAVKFNLDEVGNFAILKLREKTPEDREFLEETADFNLGDIILQDKKNSILKTQIQSRVKTSYKLDEEGIKQTAKGKNSATIKEELEKDNKIKNVEIKFWPFWIKKVPKATHKIKIRLTAPSPSSNISLNLQ